MALILLRDFFEPTSADPRSPEPPTPSPLIPLTDLFPPESPSPASLVPFHKPRIPLTDLFQSGWITSSGGSPRTPIVRPRTFRLPGAPPAPPEAPPPLVSPLASAGLGLGASVNQVLAALSNADSLRTLGSGLGLGLGALNVLRAFDPNSPAVTRALSGASGATQIPSALIRLFPELAARFVPGVNLSPTGALTGFTTTGLDLAGSGLGLASSALALAKGNKLAGASGLLTNIPNTFAIPAVSHALLGASAVPDFALGLSAGGPVFALGKALIDSLISSEGFLNPMGPGNPSARSRALAQAAQGSLRLSDALHQVRERGVPGIAAALNWALGRNLTPQDITADTLRQELTGSAFDNGRGGSTGNVAAIKLAEALLRANLPPGSDLLSPFDPAILAQARINILANPPTPPPGTFPEAEVREFGPQGRATWTAQNKLQETPETPLNRPDIPPLYAEGIAPDFLRGLFPGREILTPDMLKTQSDIQSGVLSPAAGIGSLGGSLVKKPEPIFSSPYEAALQGLDIFGQPLPQPVPG